MRCSNLYGPFAKGRIPLCGFAARCIKEGNLETYLISKTVTIVPEYLREFYLPNETINSSVITIADFTRQYLIENYKIRCWNRMSIQLICVRRLGSRQMNSLSYNPLGWCNARVSNMPLSWSVFWEEKPIWSFPIIW